MPVRSLLTAAAIPVALLLAAFFAFVGYHKAFAPLAQHRVWTLALPEWLGRTIGWSELLLAAILLSIAVPRLCAWAGMAALLLVINQMAAAAVHWSRAETDALPQNAVLVALLVLVGLAARHRQNAVGETS